MNGNLMKRDIASGIVNLTVARPEHKYLMHILKGSHKSLTAVVAIFILLVFTTCGREELFEAMDASPTDTTAEQTDLYVESVSPTNGSWLASQQYTWNAVTVQDHTVTIIFRESIDPATIQFSGTLGALAKGTFSQTNVENDTLLVEPITTWSSPLSNAALTITCTTASGTSISREYRYNVAGILVFTRTTGIDTAPGSRNAPVANITTAINRAPDIAALNSLSGSTICILLAGGTYDNGGATLNIPAGYTISGGYNPADWNSRSISGYPTIINDSRTDASTATPISTVALSSVSNTTLDGLHIRAPQLQTNSGASIEITARALSIDGGSPRINQCTLTGVMTATTASMIHSQTVYIANGAPEITYCTINPGSLAGPDSKTTGMAVISAPSILTSTRINNGFSTGTNAKTIGLLIQDASPTVTSCTFYGGTAQTSSTGVEVSKLTSTVSTPTLKTCTINGGSSNESRGVVCSGDTAKPVLIECTINGGTGTSSSTGVLSDTTAYPTIQKCTINTGATASSAYGCLINDAGMDIHGNSINPESTASLSIGIYILSSNSAATNIYNNIIHGGIAASTTGIFLDGAARFYIRNNAINGGSGTSDRTAISIKSVTNGQSAIQNNLIFCDSGANSTGVSEIATVSSMDSLRNNCIFNCMVLYVNDISNSTSNISDVNSLGDISDNGGNINEEIYAQLDPANGYRFIGEYLGTQFYKGGLNGQFSYSFGFSDDRDGSPRSPLDSTPTGWSIGPYEYD